MARPRKKGLESFAHSTQSNTAIQLVEAKYGLEGYALYFKLLERIYAQGESIVADEEFLLLFFKECSIPFNKGKEILEYLLKVGLFCQQSFQTSFVLTNEKIKMEYEKNTKRRVKDAETQPKPAKTQVYTAEKVVSATETQVSAYINPNQPIKESISAYTNPSFCIHKPQFLHTQTPVSNEKTQKNEDINNNNILYNNSIYTNNIIYNNNQEKNKKNKKNKENQEKKSAKNQKTLIYTKNMTVEELTEGMRIQTPQKFKVFKDTCENTPPYEVMKKFLLTHENKIYPSWDELAVHLNNYIAKQKQIEKQPKPAYSSEYKPRTYHKSIMPETHINAFKKDF